MAVDIETIGIAVDTTGVVKGERELKSFGATADKASRNADGLTSSIGGLAKSFLGAYAGIQGFAAAVKSLDQFARYEAIIKNATRTQAEFNKAMSESTRIANAAQSDIDGIARTYARFSNALREFNATQGQVSDLTETVALALKANGASATETSSAMLQLSQAFGAGRLSGDEFRSMAEAAPNLMRDLARSIGVPVGALKDMGAEGQLTTEMLLKAFTNPELLATYRKQASEIRTIGGAWQELVNTITVGLAKVDKELGTSRFFQGLLGQFSMGIKVLTGQTETYLDGVIKKSVQAGEAILNALGIQSKAQKDADAERRKRAGSGIFGDANPITYGNPVIPGILSNPVGAIDVNKLHQRQEEERRILDKINEERKKAADEVAKYERELAQAESAWKAKQANDYQEQLRKDYDKAQKEKKRLDDELAKAEYESKKRYMDMLSKEAEKNYNEAQKAAKKAADDLEKEYNRISDNLSRSLTDAIYRGFERGYSFVDNFIETLKNTFKTLVLQPAIQFLVDSSGITKVLAAVGAVFSGGVAAATGEETGTIFDRGLKIVDAIKTGFKGLNDGFANSIADLGTYLSTGTGGLGDQIGGFLGQYSTQISNVLGYAGAAFAGFNYLKDGNYIGAGLTAAGAAFGGPIGGAIGAAIGSLFGGKSPPMVGSQATGTFSSGKYSGSYGQYGKKDIGAGASLNQISEAFATSLGQLLGAYGLNDRVRTNALYRQRTNIKGYFGASFAGGSFYDYLGKGIDFQSYASTILGSELVKAIKMSSLPKEIRNLFNGITDKTAVQTMIAATISLTDNQAALASKYDLTATTAAAVASATGLAGDNLAQFIGTLTQTAYSSQKLSEQMIQQRDKLKEALTDAGGNSSISGDLKAFDEFLKGLDKTTSAGQKEFADLFLLRDQVASVDKAWSQLMDGVNSSIYGMLSPSEKMALDQANLAKAFAELNLAVPTSIAELIALGKSIDYGTEAGLDLALAFPALVAMFDQTKEAVNSLTQDLNANYFSTRADYMSAKASESPLSYIKNQAQMNTEMLAEIRKLQQDGADTKAILLAVSEYTYKQNRTTDDWNVNGMPPVRAE